MKENGGSLKNNSEFSVKPLFVNQENNRNSNLIPVEYEYEKE